MNPRVAQGVSDSLLRTQQADRSPPTLPLFTRGGPCGERLLTTPEDIVYVTKEKLPGRDRCPIAAHECRVERAHLSRGLLMFRRRDQQPTFAARDRLRQRWGGHK
ncbi:MAG: hypothetical protein JO007_07335 [Alphaproteobacteria bacterium]|nr:hypothetical protein [Alphaproteobacteria bacterium]